MSNFKNKNILITGGTGSFGNQLIDFLKNEDIQFYVFSRDEKKQYDMHLERKNEKIKYIVGDIRDKNKLIKALNDIDYVFHAAALKHVPTGENFPEEVIKTNINGTMNVIQAAEYCGVEKVVMLSTDKAVYPINAYGMSKAIAEKIINAHKGETPCVVLRYGNVLGSRGSVLPLFINQIRRNLPLTVTNIHMTRYLLTLDEAVKLALYCIFNGKNGDLFVIKSPACTLETLVQSLELHFKKPIERKIIGIRPGEKMHETLLTRDEVHRSSTEEKDGIIYARIPKLEKNIGDYFYLGEKYQIPEPFTSMNTLQYDAAQTLKKIYNAGLL